MFRWAQKDRKQRNLSKCSIKSYAQTSQQTHTQSPTTTTKTKPNQQRGSSAKKLKFITPNRSKQKPTLSNTPITFQNLITRDEIIQLLNTNTKQSTKPKIKPLQFTISNDTTTFKKHITIKIEVNKLITQYCCIAQQFLSKQPWSIFVVASILKTMGFVQDLVNDRNLIKQLWQELKQPDILSLYTYVEQVFSNRVQIELAIKHIAIILKIECDKLDKNHAIEIIAQKLGANFYQKLRNNRFSRQAMNTQTHALVNSLQI